MSDLDHTVRNEGSIITITPHSAAARDWIAENVDPDAHWFGPALCVEPRYAGELLYGMQEAGLESNITVEPV
ncbi:hypothetical protein vBCbaSRXM_7 [Citromicrobium phage vB_CbaS-RXM]|nr:hypothetical protein vBCbaSRXM_7 [Citromicrobium phage vB_CbaS-RXM]